MWSKNAKSPKMIHLETPHNESYWNNIILIEISVQSELELFDSTHSE